jgi:hypothetical protein
VKFNATLADNRVLELTSGFGVSNIQSHSINVRLMRIEKHLSSLVRLVSVQSPIRLPLTRSARHLFNALNARDSGIHVRIAADRNRQT